MAFLLRDAIYFIKKPSQTLGQEESSLSSEILRK